MRDILSDLEAGKADADPIVRARRGLKPELPRRFYRDVAVAPVEGGFGVMLDGKSVRTPGRAVLTLPNEAAARLVADEFAMQREYIEAVTMPVMRLVNTAIDGVAQEPDAVAEDILRFASSDLLFYRADAPARLVERQAAAWDPPLDWAQREIGGRFVLAEGVMHVQQPRETIGAVRIHLDRRREPLRLAALHLMTTISGSALLALAVEAGGLSREDAWTAANVDEDWNAEQWGMDAEAAVRHANRKRDFDGAVALLDAL